MEIDVCFLPSYKLGALCSAQEILRNSCASPTYIRTLSRAGGWGRETLLERQAEGICLAKAKGVYKGRVRGSVESKVEVLSKYKSVVRLLKENMSVRKTAKLADVSLGTVQKVKNLMVAS